MKFRQSERAPITLQRPNATQDSTGGFTTTWTNVRNAIAEVMERGKGTFFNQEAFSSEKSYVFRLRVDNQTPNVNTSMRILYKGEAYQVDSVMRIGRSIVEVSAIRIDTGELVENVWILATGTWNQAGFWTRDDRWIRDPQSA